MQNSLVTCTKCKAILPAEMLNLGGLFPCPSCSVPLQVNAFPALFRPLQAVHAENVMMEGESSCFYHPQKKAAVPCDGCGRFLCGLCDVELNGQHLCTSCVETGRKKGKIKNLQNHRVLYDNVALSLALLPLLLFYFTLVTAPMALYLAIRHWNTPSSIVPRRPKLRLTFAIIFASLQIIAWIIGICLLVTHF
jgi:hypothetical protein